MKITDIEPQKKKTDRVNVFIDGQFAFGISMALRFENKLEVGQEISESKIKELVQKDQIERLVNKSLRLLSYRPRSEKEIREHLLRKGRLVDIKSEEEKAQYNQSIEEVIKQLKKLDQIDDVAFAKWWVEQRLRFKPQALGSIKRELLVKGVDREIIDELIADKKIASPDNAFGVSRGGRATTDSTDSMTEGTENEGNIDENLAIRAASKKLTSYKNLEPKDFRIKMGQYLARKGFSWEIIKKTVDSLAGKRVK